MRFGAVAQNPAEWVVQRLNLAQQPLLDTQMAYTLARVIMEGVRVGAFDGDRVVHRAGDALSDDLGEGTYDVVLVSQLVHHFSAEQNRELAGRIARALRPGGMYVIFDAFRPASAADAGQLGALMEFYFALTRSSGTWSPEEMASWQRDAGLEPRDAIHLRTAPGAGFQAAAKPG